MIPAIFKITLPIMKILGDGDQHKVKDVIKELSIQFELTDEERRKLTPIGKRRVFDTRVMWAVSTLRNTGCLKNRVYD